MAIVTHELRLAKCAAPLEPPLNEVGVVPGAEEVAAEDDAADDAPVEDDNPVVDADAEPEEEELMAVEEEDAEVDGVAPIVKSSLRAYTSLISVMFTAHK